MNIIPEEINEYLSYDEITGLCTWIKKTGSRSTVGTITGSQTNKGYTSIMFKGVNYLTHRLAWYIKTGNQPINQIDHINGNKADNTWTNLREATDSENQHNKGKRIDNKSGYKGVSWFKKNSKWRARIKHNNKQYHLGLFLTPEEAYAEYCRAADEFHGDFKNYGN